MESPLPSQLGKEIKGRTSEDNTDIEEDRNNHIEPSSPLSRATTHDSEKDIEHGRISRTATTQSFYDRVSLPHEILFVFVLSSAQMLTQGAVNQAILLGPILQKHFGVTHNVTWTAAGFSLTVGSFILVFGRLGDMFGYRRMMMIGYLWFSLWTLACGLAVYSNFTLFVFARVMQGIGPSILLPNALALFGAAYSPGFRKGLVFSLFGASAPVGAVIGGVVTALFSKIWWPWTFFTFAIIEAVLGIATYFVVPDFLERANHPPSTLRGTLIAADLPGGAVGVAALILFNFAWNQAPSVGWAEPYVIVTLILGILLVPVFFYIETRVSPNPLIPFEAVTADVGLVLGCLSLGWGCFGVWIWYTFQEYLVLRHFSPILSMAWFSPVAISGPIAAIITSFLLRRLGPAPVMTMALCAFTTGMILLSTAPIDQIYWAQNFVGMVIMPFGMDMSFPAATIILSDSVKREHQGVAASLVNTVVNYSISLALGFAGTVEVQQNRGGKTPADVLHGYRSAMYLGVALAGFGVIVSLLFLIKHSFQSRKTGQDAEPAQVETK